MARLRRGAGARGEFVMMLLSRQDLVSFTTKEELRIAHLARGLPGLEIWRIEKFQARRVASSRAVVLACRSPLLSRSGLARAGVRA